MNTLKYLISRNIKLYLRNKSTVFFSFLSMIIIIGLYALFMADAQIDSLALQYGGSREIAEWLINSWIMGGIITVNAVNITLVLLVNMVEDKSNNHIKDFLVAPIKKYQIIGGYLGAAIIVGILMSIVSVVIAELYIVTNGGEFLSFISMFKVLIGIIFTVISVSSMSLFFLLFIKSEKTASTITTIVGTLIGFVAGVYVPIGLMPNFIQSLMKLLPITYSATLFKQIFVLEPSKLVFNNASELLKFNKLLGNVIYVGNNEVTYNMYLIILTVTTVIFFTLALIKIKMDNKWGIMKKALIFVSIVVVVIIIAAVIGLNNFSSNYEKQMKELVIENVDMSTIEDGTYQGKYSIFPIIVEVEVTVSDQRITAIDIIKHQTGQGQGAEVIVDDVILKQSLQVDTISKATGSSKVILKAIEDALTK